MFKSSTMGKAVPIHDQTVAKVHIYTAIICHNIISSVQNDNCVLYPIVMLVMCCNYQTRHTIFVFVNQKPPKHNQNCMAVIFRLGLFSGKVIFNFNSACTSIMFASHVFHYISNFLCYLLPRTSFLLLPRTFLYLKLVVSFSKLFSLYSCLLCFFKHVSVLVLLFLVVHCCPITSIFILTLLHLPLSFSLHGLTISVSLL